MFKNEGNEESHKRMYTVPETIESLGEVKRGF
jgi:hypothetical protein